MANKHNLTDAANIAAKWWRFAFENLNPHNNFDNINSNQSFILHTKTWMLLDQKRASTEAYDLFQEALSARIYDYLKQAFRNRCHEFCINDSKSDCESSEILSDSAEIAGIDVSNDSYNRNRRMIIRRVRTDYYTISIIDGCSIRNL